MLNLYLGQSRSITYVHIMLIIKWFVGWLAADDVELHAKDIFFRRLHNWNGENEYYMCTFSLDVNVCAYSLHLVVVSQPLYAKSESCSERLNIN